jgi:hypothetical protein
MSSERGGSGGGAAPPTIHMDTLVEDAVTEHFAEPARTPYQSADVSRQQSTVDDYGYGKNFNPIFAITYTKLFLTHFLRYF